MYGRAAGLMAARFLLKHRNKMFNLTHGETDKDRKEIGLHDAFRQMRKGIRMEQEQGKE